MGNDDSKSNNKEKPTTGRRLTVSSASRTKYVRNCKTISGSLHDELVMMDLEQGKYFSLNPVATRIWSLLERPVTVEALCDELQQEYEVGHKTCFNEVKEYINEMLRLRLVFELK